LLCTNVNTEDSLKPIVRQQFSESRKKSDKNLIKGEEWLTGQSSGGDGK